MKNLYLTLEIALLFATNLLSQDFEVDGIAYNITSAEAPYTVEVTSKTPRYEGDVVIPEEVFYEERIYSVATIGNSAFKGCNRLTNIDIPNSVTNIGDSAFEGCTKITSISIPNSVMDISNSAFWDCSDLISIDVDIDNEYYSSTDGVLYNKDKTLLLKYPENKAGGFLIPSSVLTVGDFAFRRSSGLTSIEFSNSLTTIGIWVFS